MSCGTKTRRGYRTQRCRYLAPVIGEIKKLDPDVVVPMHCSGENVIRALPEQMPGRLLVSYKGARLTFGA